ncbi:hypothetical protein KM1_095660 [Entamoeba histolytica HM-3:IMSS]|uniref:Uncharacterized protein n=4 Tax=Entamoeba histolytica TaxID=5759 RepID=C4M6V1_ENTH1|nr:hypothetical protein EHI_054100 [Entamoeba histolytica HM-1:IMSS]EAL46031.1 hypothetical protein EHI_054100 [Entamoeba histolytica HM-1:IMSS]EMS16330.1 hypothetical protein KM1_095660 [Entamoeba histolytica HM-3:IMSS]ENY60716.1 hypothetical protein EHI7A_049540 [Entamoeba histolytica HM-1:IMSS-A]GAT97211.1 hypothetical protein CL6EHI_054100 [Entamoeba histolytica]|eukprot:XP_651417.1 hypothetical protein EHI_054100 [Entamoeba histolytica HM-1:IMSS]
MNTSSETMSNSQPPITPVIALTTLRITSPPNTTIHHGSLFKEQDSKKLQMYLNRPSRTVIENELLPRQPYLTIHTSRTTVLKDDVVFKQNNVSVIKQYNHFKQEK